MTLWYNTVLHFLLYLLKQDNSVAIVQVDFHFTQTIVLYKVNFLTSENLTIPNEKLFRQCQEKKPMKEILLKYSMNNSLLNSFYSPTNFSALSTFHAYPSIIVYFRIKNIYNSTGLNHLLFYFSFVSNVSQLKSVILQAPPEDLNSIKMPLSI